MNYRIDILRNYVPIGTLAVSSCSVSFNADAKIKRSASITTNMDEMDLTVSNFERMSDRIMPVVIEDDGTEHPVGLFMLVSDPVSYGSAYNETQLELYDESYILNQSAFDTRHYYAATTKYMDVFSSILTECGLTRQNIEPSSGALLVDREFAVGDNIMDTLNTLLEEAGYESLFMDSNGFATCRLKSDKYEPDFVYRSGDSSSIQNSISANVDVYGIPNVFVGLVSSPDQSVLTYTAENHNLNSDLSIERRGYKLTKVYKLDSAASLASLKSYIDTLLNESMTALQTVSFTSALETGHEFKNVLQIETDDISGLYIEKKWSMTFGTDAQMSHNAERRVVV